MAEAIAPTGFAFQTLTIHTNYPTPAIHRLWTDWQPYDAMVANSSIHMTFVGTLDVQLETVADGREIYLSTELDLPLPGFSRQLSLLTKRLNLHEQSGIQIKYLSTAYLPGPTWPLQPINHPDNPPLIQLI